MTRLSYYRLLAWLFGLNEVNYELNWLGIILDCECVFCELNFWRLLYHYHTDDWKMLIYISFTENADAMLSLQADCIEKDTEMYNDIQFIEYLLKCIKSFRRVVYHITGETLEDLDGNAMTTEAATGILKSFAYGILNRYKLYPYHYKHVQT